MRFYLCCWLLLFFVAVLTAQSSFTAFSHSPSNGHIEQVAESERFYFVSGPEQWFSPAPFVACYDLKTQTPLPPPFRPDAPPQQIIPDGKDGFFVLGDFIHIDGVHTPLLARLRADFSLDPSWSARMDTVITVMAQMHPTLATGHCSITMSPDATLLYLLWGTDDKNKKTVLWQLHLPSGKWQQRKVFAQDVHIVHTQGTDIYLQSVYYPSSQLADAPIRDSILCLSGDVLRSVARVSYHPEHVLSQRWVFHHQTLYYIGNKSRKATDNNWTWQAFQLATGQEDTLFYAKMKKNLDNKNIAFDQLHVFVSQDQLYLETDSRLFLWDAPTNDWVTPPLPSRSGRSTTTRSQRRYTLDPANNALYLHANNEKKQLFKGTSFQYHDVAGYGGYVSPRSQWLVSDQNKLLFIGNFIGVDGLDLGSLVRFRKSDMGLDTSWQPRPDGSIRTMHIAANRLFVFGSIGQIAQQPRHYFACFDHIDSDLPTLSPLQVDDNYTAPQLLDHSPQWLYIKTTHKGQPILVQLPVDAPLLSKAEIEEIPASLRAIAVTDNEVWTLHTASEDNLIKLYRHDNLQSLTPLGAPIHTFDKGNEAKFIKSNDKILACVTYSNYPYLDLTLFDIHTKEAYPTQTLPDVDGYFIRQDQFFSPLREPTTTTKGEFRWQFVYNQPAALAFTAHTLFPFQPSYMALPATIHAPNESGEWAFLYPLGSRFVLRGAFQSLNGNSKPSGLVLLDMQDVPRYTPILPVSNKTPEWVEKHKIITSWNDQERKLLLLSHDYASFTFCTVSLFDSKGKPVDAVFPMVYFWRIQSPLLLDLSKLPVDTYELLIESSVKETVRYRIAP